MSDRDDSGTTSPAPLQGLRVVEFTHMVMGPAVGAILVELGAEVIKVEPIGGDATRQLLGSGAGYFSMYNRNKKSLCLNLKDPRGLALARRLAASADVVVENFRAGTMDKLGLGYGDANTLVHLALTSDGQSAAAGQSGEDVLAGIYADKKAPLRPIHDALMAAIGRFGEFEIAPKKGYVSLRRKKQFAMIGPGSATRVDLGLNMKDVAATDRLLAEKPGGMCQYKVKLTSASEVDAELIGWIRRAYEAAG